MKHEAQNKILISLVILVLLAWGAVNAAAQDAAQEKVKVTGIITTHTTSPTGHSMTLQTAKGSSTVLLGSDVTVQDSGFWMPEKRYYTSALTPGLEVTVEGVSSDDGKTINAKKITLDGLDDKDR
jgi:hypothetical protein